jgi:DNA invertase Pin-like site-specific DNA recombinase
MIRAALYLRVSTTEQDLTLQREPLMRLVKQRGWELGGIYEDQESGASAARSGLNRLMRDAKQGKFNVVAVYRFDRFARSVKQLVDALESFHCWNVDFVSYHEQIDTSTPIGKLLFTHIAAIAEFERSLIQQRVKEGIAHARSTGVKFGRPRAVFDRSVRQIAKALGVGRGTIDACLKSGDLAQAS